MTLDLLPVSSFAVQIEGGVTMGRILSCRCFAIVARSILLATLCACVIPARAQKKPEGSKAVLMANQPISFEPNRGQANAPANFVVRAPGLAVSLRATGLDLLLDGDAGEAARLGMSFVASDAAAEVVGSELQESYTNYILGNDPAKWLAHIPNFGRVTYRGIYPGVDIAYYGNREQLEHDFIVAPNADYRLIRIRLNGQEHLKLQADGSLKVVFPGGNLSFGRPDVYQSIGGEKVAVSGRYVLISKNEIRFEIGRYDRSEPLVIDPILTYSTFLADMSLGVSSVATDAAGDTFVTGIASSSSFPTTTGAFQTTCKSCPNFPDVFITKMNPAGTGLVYSTYLGGSSYDQPFGIAVDQNGNAIVAGYTQSTDFPLKNPVMTAVTNTGTQLGFITSLTADGSALNYSSVLGGNGTANGSTTSVGGVAVDTNGNAYISGTTDSAAYPVTTLDVVTPAYPNNVVFLTKFLPSGAIGYSALLGDVSPTNGGGGPIGVMGIAVDSTGSAYITGAGGTLWPTTSGAFQTSIPGAMPYAAPFVTKLSPDGSSVDYSTFLGDTGQPTGITVNGTGEAFVTGIFPSSNFPTTTNAYQKTIPASSCCASFVTEFNASGSALIYSTFLYGNLGQVPASTNATGIALDSDGGIWVSGGTSDLSFPLVSPLQSIAAIGTFQFTTSTGFISRFDPTGAELTFSSLFGGTVQGGTIDGVAIDPNNKAHIVGTTGSGLFTTPGAYLSTVTTPPPNVEFTWGYVAVIDASVPASAPCFSTNEFDFGNVNLGTTSAIPLTITNCGAEPLVIDSVTSPNPTFTVPANFNGCQQPVAVNASCKLSVAFSPTALGPQNSALTIVSNASIPSAQMPMTGAGAVAQIQVQTTSLVFNPEFIGQTSPSLILIVSNSGGVPLQINLAKTTISAGFAFGVAPACNQIIFPQAEEVPPCVFTVTSTPTVAGTQTGTLSIASNDPVTPNLAISLTGTGINLYPAPILSIVSPATVPIGTASVTLQLNGGNFFPASIVYVAGVPQPTTYTSVSTLTATVSASAFTALGEIPVTVFNPAPGGGESAPYTITTYQSIVMAASALVSDPVTKLLYASIGAGAASNPNTVAVIDPVAGTVKQFLPVGNDPEKLAMSGDGQFIYVGLNGAQAIQRINASTLTIDENFLLPTVGEPVTISDMKVVPGSPNSLVVALGLSGGGAGEAGIALYSGQALVNVITPQFNNQFFAASSFDFAGTPPVVYSLPATINGIFGSFTIDGLGIHLQTAGTPGSFSQVTGLTVVSDGTLLYTNSGQVWNPSPQALVGTYNPPLNFAGSVLPSTALGRTFFIDPFATFDDFGAVAVDAYDQKALTLDGTVPFLSSTVGFTPAIDLTLWGTNGFAFIGGGSPATSDISQLIIFRSSIAGVASGQNPFPVLTSLGPSSALSGGPSFSLSVTGSNFTNGSTVQWNGSARTTTLVSATQLNAAITAADIASPGTALVTVSNPAPGGGVSSPLTFTIVASPAAAVLSTNSLTFSAQLVSSTSATQFVTLTNPGGMSLSISGGIQITGDFAQTNTCALSLPSQGSCVISVTFTPTTTGTRTGSISITDNAANSPQVISLTGTGTVPDFTFPTGGSNVTIATVTAGQTANYSLSLLASATFNGTVNLTCGNVPVNSHCTVTPTSIALTSGKASTFTVAVVTNSSATLLIPLLEMILAATCLAGLIALPFAWGRNHFPRVRRARAYGFALMMAAYLIVAGGMVGCGGGGTPPPPTSTTTVPGTYSILVTGTDGTTTQTLSLTLVVQ
jgi:Abnormal spindle-like microcephaly-assoc'd, ASPM-SPD-2-Hydin/Beta-propeller repeat